MRWTLALVAVAFIGAVLVLPLVSVFVEALGAGWGPVLAALRDPDAVDAMRLTLVIAAIVVPVNTVFGVAAAWCLVRFRFPGRGVLRAVVGLPFSISPVVAGLAYIMVFGGQGWFAPALQALGVRVVFALPGMVLCTMFVTVPFVAGQLIPLMEAGESGGGGVAEEEAALTLGAGFWQVLWHVTLPRVRWGLAFGVLLCNARAMGEFGAVSVVSGHIRGLTNTMPLQIEILYNQYDMPAAFSLAAVLACLALLTVAARTVLEWRQARTERIGQDAVLAAF